MLKFANAIIDCEGGDEFVTASRSLHCGVRSVVHNILHICIMGGLGESTNNGSDPKSMIYTSTNRSMNTNITIHMIIYGEKWVNQPMDPIRSVHTVFAITTSNK